MLVIVVAVGITLAATLGGGGTGPASSTAGPPQLRLAALSTLGRLQAAPAAGRLGPEGCRSRPPRR